MSSPTTKKILSASIKAVLTGVILYFVFVQLKDNWQQIVHYQWHLNITLLVASLILHLVTFALFAWVWCRLMTGFGHEVPLRHGFKVAYIANLGRYVPGRIWPIFGMLYVANQIKIPKETAVTSWGIAQIYAIPPSLAVALAGMWLYPELLSGDWGTYLKNQLPLLTTVTVAMSACLLFLPKLVVALLNWILVRFKRPTVAFDLSVGRAALIYVGYLACWTLYGVAFWVFLRSLSPDHAMGIGPAIAAFVTAYQTGYFMIFTPGGLGTRELVLSATLAPFIGPASVGIAITARVWNTISDVIVSVIAIKIRL
jgi:hypothetical protein